MKSFALVSIETFEPDKAPRVIHITVGGDYLSQPSEIELFTTAQEYINNDNLRYQLLNITYLTEEQYNSFLQGQIADYLRSE